jgi:hypothetical protein
VILSHRWRDFRRVEHGALEERGIELTLKLAFAPSLLNRKPHVKLALFPALALPKNDEMMRPRYLSHQWRDN